MKKMYYYLVRETRINNEKNLNYYVKTKKEFEDFKKLVPYNFKSFEILKEREATPKEIKEENYNRTVIKTMIEHPNIEACFNNKKG